MAEHRFRVVYDCNVLWRAFFFGNGLGSECRRLIQDKLVEHFVSTETVEELLDVLTREETLARFPNYSSENAKDFVRQIISESTLVKKVPSVATLPRDSDDEPYLNLAAAIEAAYLVTSDRDLLDLMTGIDVESKQFRQRLRHLTIVRPDEFLRIILDRELPLEP
ncbi:MAG: putative toxin-antitoxin system toxin component, PIN family [Pyrinomonadaceae bacterium]